MWSISEVKTIGKSSFKANYWPCVLVAFLMSLFTGVYSSSARGQSQQLSSGASGSLSSEEQIAIAIGIFIAGLVVIGIAIVIKIFLANPIIVGGVITLGLGIVFWTGPYIQSTNAALYLKLKGQQV